MHRPSRAGLTLVEISIGLGLTVMVLAALHALWVGVATRGIRSGEDSEALRSVSIALDTIRRDLDRMLYQCPGRDLGILDGGRGLSVRVPAPGGSSDPWTARYVPVTYRLRRARPDGSAWWLVRKDPLGERTISGCLLADLRVESVPLRGRPGGLSDLQAYLEVTVVGKGSGRGTSTHVATTLHPLTLMAATGAYSTRL